MICATCGYHAGTDTVNMYDFCPNCKQTPFIEKEEATDDK